VNITDWVVPLCKKFTKKIEKMEGLSLRARLEKRLLGPSDEDPHIPVDAASSAVGNGGNGFGKFLSSASSSSASSSAVPVTGQSSSILMSYYHNHFLEEDEDDIGDEPRYSDEENDAIPMFPDDEDTCSSTSTINEPNSSRRMKLGPIVDLTGLSRMCTDNYSRPSSYNSDGLNMQSNKAHRSENNTRSSCFVDLTSPEMEPSQKKYKLLSSTTGASVSDSMSSSSARSNDSRIHESLSGKSTFWSSKLMELSKRLKIAEADADSLGQNSQDTEESSASPEKAVSIAAAANSTSLLHRRLELIVCDDDSEPEIMDRETFFGSHSVTPSAAESTADITTTKPKHVNKSKRSKSKPATSAAIVGFVDENVSANLSDAAYYSDEARPAKRSTNNKKLKSTESSIETTVGIDATMESWAASAATSSGSNSLAASATKASTTEDVSMVTDSSEWEVVLVIDKREKDNQFLQSTLLANGVPCVISNLAVGDFLWVARPRSHGYLDNNTLTGDASQWTGLGSETECVVVGCVVERKTVADLASSICDGRYHEQKMRLRDCAVKSKLYIVEGLSLTGGLPRHSIVTTGSLRTAMVATSVDFGIAVVRTRGLDHTVSLLSTLHRRNQSQFSQAHRNRQLYTFMSLQKYQQLYGKRSANTTGELLMYQLKQIPGCSTATALALHKKFETFAKMMQWMNRTPPQDAVVSFYF
jgi:ERCC4-type nuclease